MMALCRRKRTNNYLPDRAHGMEPLLQWMLKRQLQKIEPEDVATADAGMHCPNALSRNLVGLPQPGSYWHFGIS